VHCPVLWLLIPERPKIAQGEIHDDVA